MKLLLSRLHDWMNKLLIFYFLFWSNLINLLNFTLGCWVNLLTFSKFWFNYIQLLMELGSRDNFMQVQET